MRLGVAAGATLIFFGCSSSEEVSGSSAGPVLGGQNSTEWKPVPDEPIVYGVVIDDVDDAAGEAVRERMLQDLREILMDDLIVGGQALDPARYQPIDIRIALGFPSYAISRSERTLRKVTWLDQPALRWQAEYRRIEDVDVLMSSVEDVVVANVRLDASEEPGVAKNAVTPGNVENGFQVRLATRWAYAPVAALHALGDFLYATVCSGGKSNSILPAPPNLELHLVTGRDDEQTSLGSLFWKLFDAATDPNPVCYTWIKMDIDSGSGSTRLQALAQEADTEYATFDPWEDSTNLFLRFGVSYGWLSCSPWPYQQDAEGLWRCKQIVETDVDQCDPNRGWRDPLNDAGEREETLDTRWGYRLRVCEVDQLRGMDKELCETSPACEDCRPGWCIPTAPELRPAALSQCSIDTTPLSEVRFIGPSELGPKELGGRHRAVCER